MALVDQDKDEKIINALSYVTAKFRHAEIDLYEETNPDGKFDSTWVSGRDAESKAKVSDGIRMLRWLFDNLVVTVPTAFNDGEVDAINPFIRQKDDGL